MKFARDINTILCDDIRNEEGNKKSLMGVYLDNYVIPKTGISMPKLCLAIFFNGIKDLIPPLKITFFNPGYDPVTMGMKAPQLPDINSGVSSANLGIIISPFRIKACGEARFELNFGTESAPEIIHRFTIKTFDEAVKP